MASRYSPYTAPSVDSASDYSPEHEPSTTAAPQTTKRRARGSMTAEERRDARAHRNRLAAQCSRDRKKAQFETLMTRVSQLEEENRSLRLGLATSSQPSLSTSVDATLMEENRQLRDRIQQLEMAWQNMTKILGAMSIPVPPTQSSTSVRPDALIALPLSPAPTTSSPKSEPIFDEPSTLLSESTCELAAGGSLGTLFGDSIIGRSEAVGTTTNNNNTTHTPALFDNSLTSPTTSTPNLGGGWDSSLLLSTPLEQGYNEMDRLLSILPSPNNDAGLTTILSSNNEDWAWLNDGF